MESIIGADRLNFRVRDGIGCDPIAKATRMLRPFYVIVADVNTNVIPITATITKKTKIRVILALNFSIFNLLNTQNGCD